MSRKKTMPELYIAFHMGFTVKDLISRGLPRASVYNYHRNYKNKVKPAFDGLLKSVQVNS